MDVGRGEYVLHDSCWKQKVYLISEHVRAIGNSPDNGNWRNVFLCVFF